MDEISALMGMGITNEEQLRAMADGLRGQKRAADAFALSTVPEIQASAQNQQQSILEGAKQAGLAKAKEADRLSREKIAKKNREATIDAAEIRAGAEGREGKPPAAMAGTFQNNLSLQMRIKRMNGIYSSMNAEQRDAVDNAPESVGLALLDKVTPEGTARLVAENTLYADPLVQEYLATGHKIKSGLSRALSGTALTKYEIRDRDEWQPMAAGIGQKQRQIRLNNIYADLVADQGAFQAAYPEYGSTVLENFKSTYGDVSYSLPNFEEAGGTVGGSAATAPTEMTVDAFGKLSVDAKQAYLDTLTDPKKFRAFYEEVKAARGQEAPPTTPKVTPEVLPPTLLGTEHEPFQTQRQAERQRMQEETEQSNRALADKVKSGFRYLKKSGDKVAPYYGTQQ
jgi:hypothetical protein